MAHLFSGHKQGPVYRCVVDRSRPGTQPGPNTLLQTADGGNTWSTIGGLSSTIQAISVIDKTEARHSRFT